MDKCKASGCCFSNFYKVDGDKLTCAGTDFWEDACCKGFKAASEGFTFTSGTGLPGRVWASQGQEVCANVQTLDPSKFARMDKAKEFGLKGAVGIWKNGGVYEFFSEKELTEADAKALADCC